MQVSFNGINNVRIFKKEYAKYGAYIAQDNNVKQGDKHYTVVKISCNLSDDENGMDLTEFRNALAKSGDRYESNCINHQEPDKVELILTRQDVKDTKGHVSMSDFMINNFEIMLNSKETLPMFSYIARLSRKIASLEGLNQPRKDCINLINKSAEDEAVKFIESI